MDNQNTDIPSFPHPAQQGLSSLANMLYGRPQVNGMYFNGKAIRLDGYDFHGCRFDNCTLEVNSTNFSIVSCVIDSSTAISYGVEAVKLVKLFNSKGPYNQLPPGFIPKRNLDGSITISGKS